MELCCPSTAKTPEAPAKLQNSHDCTAVARQRKRGLQQLWDSGSQGPLPRRSPAGQAQLLTSFFTQMSTGTNTVLGG